MTKIMIVCLVCIIVAASSLTPCTAARGLPPSMQSGKTPESSETRTSSTKPTAVVADVDSTQPSTSSITTESDEEVTEADWEQLSEEELGPCMEEAEEGSSSESEVVRPCRRMLPDYGSPSHNKNPKGP